MRRIYSSITGQYLGIIWQSLGVWYSEDRGVVTRRHPTAFMADAHLRKQEAFDAAAA